MKIFGIIFIVVGILVAIDGFANSVTDIQFGIGFTGVVITGIGLNLLYLSKVREELEIIYLWAKKDKE